MIIKPSHKIIKDDKVDLTYNGTAFSLLIGSGQNPCLEFACIGKSVGDSFDYLGTKVTIKNISTTSNDKDNKRKVPRVSDFFSMPKNHDSQEAENIKFGYVNDATYRMIAPRLYADNQVPTKVYGRNTTRGNGRQGEYRDPETKVICSEDIDLREYKEFRKKPYDVRLDFENEKNGERLSLYIGLHDVYDTVVEPDGYQYRFPSKTHVMKWKTRISQIVSQDSNGISTVRPQYQSDSESKTLDQLIHDSSGVLQYKGASYTLRLRRTYQFDWKSGVCFETDYDKTQNGEIFDPFLRRVLEDKRNKHEATNIVFSIQEEQREIMNLPLQKNFIVQGCAGSGKTMILMHRISILLSQESTLNAENVLILTPNEMFATSLQRLSSELEMTKVSRKSIDSFYMEAIREYLPEYSFDNFCDECNCYDRRSLSNLYSSEIFEKSKRLLDEQFEAQRNKLIDQLQILLPLFERLEISMDLKSEFPYDFHKKLSSLTNSLNDKLNKKRQSIKSKRSEIKEKQRQLQESLDAIQSAKNNVMSCVIDLIDILREIQNNSLLACKNLKQEQESISNQLKRSEDSESRTCYIKQNGEIDLAALALSGDSNLQEKAKKIQEIYSSLENQERKKSKISPFNVTERRKIQECILDLENNLCEIIDTLPKESDKLSESSVEQLMQEFQGIQNKIDLHQKKIDAIHQIVSALKSSSKEFLPDLTEIPEHEILIEELKDYCALRKTILIQTKRSENINKEIQRNAKSLEKLETALPNKEESEARKSLPILLSDFSPQKFVDDSFLTICDQFNMDAAVTCRINLLYLLRCCHQYFNCTIFPKLRLICIDEAQELAKCEFDLLNAITDQNVGWNLYGDRLQVSTPYKFSSGEDPWECAKISLNAEFYQVDANYRNAIEVVEFCNQVFDLSIRPLGLNGSVHECDFESCRSQFVDYIQTGTEDGIMPSAAIIVKTLTDNVIDDIQKAFVDIPLAIGRLEKNFVSVLDVNAAKGLEFRYELVFPKDMTTNEKYIAYTRTMEKLLVCN